MADQRVGARAWIEARKRERARLAGILHDDIAGGLTAAGLSLDLLALDSPPELEARIREIQGMLERGFESVRELSREFHPDPAVRFHLVPALEALTQRFQKQFRGTLNVRLDKTATDGLAPDRARAYYAIAEAALDNISVHSGAERVDVELEGGPEFVSLLSIRDNGKGFEESTISSGTGTAVMEYHVRVAGLELSIQSEVGRGTLVQVTPAERVRKQKKRGSHEDGD